MSNEQQFDDRVKRMFQGESVAPPAHVEERLFAQLAPSPWAKRLGLTGGVLLICAAGLWNALDESSATMEAAPLAPPTESLSIETATISKEVTDLASANGTVEFHSEMSSSSDRSVQSSSAGASSNGLTKEEVLSKESSTQIESPSLQSLDRVPASPIDLDCALPSDLQQAPEEQLVLPAVVKVKN
jgi:hypothetical protein